MRTKLVFLALLIAGPSICGYSAEAAATNSTTPAILSGQPPRVHNRQVTTFTESGREALRFDERAGDGLAWWPDTNFTNGTIEFDVRGKDVFQKSFVGVAFHGVDEKTYDAVYFRPFNFHATDPARRNHAVQYVSMPAYDWQMLRAEHPDKYEKPVVPAPAPDQWFHARILVAHPKVSVFVNDATEPCLEVEQLSDRKSGWVGFWVGNGSGGEFANLNIVTASPGFTNLDFEQGAPGQLPPGWNLPPSAAQQGFSAVLTTNQPNQGKQCAELRWPKDHIPTNFFVANLVQRVDATPWRGKRIKITSAVRIASAENRRRAQMWFRVDDPSGVAALDNMDDRPIINTNWADYSITMDVAHDAQSLRLGLMGLNGATAWWDDVRIEVLGDSNPEEFAVLEGNWRSVLEIGPIPLRLFFVFERDVANQLRGYFVSPDQSETRLPLSRLTLDGDSAKFAIAAIGGTYTGQLDRVSHEIKGSWVQRGRAFPLTLAFTKTDWKLRRPQTPQAPYPYQTEDVIFTNDAAKVTLAGTLTRPAGSGRFPALILISGSGPQDRDETLFGHKPFAVIADFLTRNGCVVLRYDDRGFGKSTGDFGSATSEDFSYDAEAALDWLKTRREVNPRRIGFLGHSEGGLIAPMIAARRTDVAFLVLLAAPGIAQTNLALAQAETFSRMQGFSDEYLQKCRPLNRQAIRIIMQSDLTLAQKQSQLDDLEQRMIPLMGEQDRQLYDKLKDKREALREIGFAQMKSPWMQFLLRCDPAADLQRVQCPVLALNGQLDTQVLASQNLPAIEKNLKAGGNSRVVTKELAGLNHLFQTAQSGDLKEYGEIEETFSPSALAEILAWLNENTGKPAPNEP